jgi:hypothetical protein
MKSWEMNIKIVCKVGSVREDRNIIVFDYQVPSNTALDKSSHQK